MEDAPKESRIGTTISVIAAILVCAFIFYMSAKPADESNELSYGVVYQIIGLAMLGYDQMTHDEQLYRQKTLMHPVRKTARFLEYAALSALVLNMSLQIGRERGRDLREPLVKTAVTSWAL